MKDTCIPALLSAGISWEDAHALRRISMTLHRWHELECGDSNNYASWCITRGRKANGTFEHDDDGAPFLERHVHSEKGTRYERIADRERGALRRLAAIMARYPTLAHFIQSDPRGVSLYVLRPGDIPEGSKVDECYSRGIAVYK